MRTGASQNWCELQFAPFVNSASYNTHLKSIFVLQRGAKTNHRRRNKRIKWCHFSVIARKLTQQKGKYTFRRSESMASRISTICQQVSSNPNEYADIFQANACPNSYQVVAYNRNTFVIAYDLDSVKYIANGPMQRLLRSYYARTNSFADESDFTPQLRQLCNSIPGACDRTLRDLCADVPLTSTTAQQMCGCFQSDDPCDAACDHSDTVKRHIGEGPNLRVCDRPICSISDVTVNRIGSSIGTVSVNSICPQCTESSPCDCLFAGSGGGVNALYRSSAKSSLCASVDCVDGNCGEIATGTNYYYAVIIGIALVLAIVVLFVIYLLA